jgi:hypothetical protein
MFGRWLPADRALCTPPAQPSKLPPQLQILSSTQCGRSFSQVPTTPPSRPDLEGLCRLLSCSRSSNVEHKQHDVSVPVALNVEAAPDEATLLSSRLPDPLRRFQRTARSLPSDSFFVVGPEKADSPFSTSTQRSTSLSMLPDLLQAFPTLEYSSSFADIEPSLDERQSWASRWLITIVNSAAVQ